MPRLARNVQNTNIFHILVEGIEGERIFPNKDFKEIYLNCLIRSFERYSISFLSYCIMDTHAHLLVYVADVLSMSTAMAEANKLYARKFNAIRERNGSVFNGRFKSQSIEFVGELRSVIEFIHSDPVRVGKSKSIRGYEYSSAALLTSGEESFLDIDRLEALLEILPDSDVATKRWSESSDSKNEEFNIVFRELIRRYHIRQPSDLMNNEMVAGEIVVELKERCGLSIRQMADLLQIGRETLRKTIVKHVAASV